MKHILIPVTVILVSLELFSQNSIRTTATNQIYFGYGQAYNLKLDNTYSRLAKNGFNHLIILAYENVKYNGILGVQGSFMFGTLKTKGNSVNIINDYAGSFALKYLKKINKTEKTNLSLYLGGNINFRGDIWFPQGSELRYGWDINLAKGFSSSLRYKTHSKLRFQYDVDVSLIGVLWRSHNNGQQLITEEIQLENGILASAFQTPRFSHVFNTLYLDNSLKLLYTLSKQTTLYFNFGLSYINIKKPLVKKGYEFDNYVGITLNL